MKRLSLRQVNNGLSVGVILLCVYVLLAPLLPNFFFWWSRKVTKSQPPLVAAHQQKQPEVIPAEDTLVIPSISLQHQIFVGPTAYPALNKGIWAYPRASSPDHGGNTVLIAHRFTYAGPSFLYHLDKVKVGDDVLMYWRRQKFVYKVTEVKVVPPTATDIQAPSDDARVTIYTCTPLMTAKNRLVVIAKPVEGTP